MHFPHAHGSLDADSSPRERASARRTPFFFFRKRTARTLEKQWEESKQKEAGRRPESNRGLLHPKQEFYHLTTAPPLETSKAQFSRRCPIYFYACRGRFFFVLMGVPNKKNGETMQGIQQVASLCFFFL